MPQTKSSNFFYDFMPSSLYYILKYVCFKKLYNIAIFFVRAENKVF